MEKAEKKPSFAYALLTVTVVFAVIMIPALAWGSKIHPLFLLSYLAALPLCMHLGVPYEKLQAGMVQSCTRAIVPILILLINGGLVGTWNASGTVPMIINLGIQFISPSLFLAAAFLLCVMCSMATGTSWGTFGTAGLALAGIGLGMGINPMLTAGAICSGAFFGDTLSPLSDGPNLCSGITGVDLFTGIRHQCRVTLPAGVICALLYLAVGLTTGGGQVDYTAVHSISRALEANFRMGIAAVVPMVIVFGMLAVKMPSIPSLLCGAFSGGVVACLVEGRTMAEVITYFWSGYSIDSGSEMVDKLLNRGGITSMSSTAILFLFAFGLFGVLNTAGIIDALVEPLTRRLRSRVSIIGATVLMSVLGNAIGASSNFAYVFAGNIMAPIYDRAGLEKVNLSRALAVGCTAMCVLLPWNMNAIVAAGYLGVTPAQLIPFTFFAYVTPAVLLLVTLLGFDTRYTAGRK
ncbi:Na+/H+ antiporter NhaC family protein [Dysosmobacter sp.]|uniref:Na+/H+ antiporter NhaC family protein n=1 Tax=Dysosmobacter sp. TaxID=2591382 RepID=UPI002A8BE180|nr:Na+/H+ antiporter NhaC family protein [Dysosmobacter sp.]MDY3281206.1 Na+/H+ antiporter NhaC family protein [Dysosmobacter sp.]